MAESSEQSETAKPATGSDLTAALMAIGRLGRFQLIEPLGAGAMGAVIRGEDRTLKRPVALKVQPMPTAEGGSSKDVERFLNEARAAAQLVHPNIVQIFEVGVSSGYAFIAMEMLEEGDLDERVKTGGVLEWKEACTLIHQAAEGLGYAHEHGILHRDIKPANLMLTKRGYCKVVDFGVAQMTSSEDAMASASKVAGTPYYQAPEAPAGTATPATDVFSLASVLWYLLTDQPPFKIKRSADVLRKGSAEIPLPTLSELRPDVPLLVSHVIETALSRNPADRYDDGNAFADALKQSIREVPTQSQRHQEDDDGLAGLAAATSGPPTYDPEADATVMAELSASSTQFGTRLGGFGREPGSKRGIVIAVVAMIALVSIGAVGAAIYAGMSGSKSDPNDTVAIKDDVDKTAGNGNDVAPMNGGSALHSAADDDPNDQSDTHDEMKSPDNVGEDENAKTDEPKVPRPKPIIAPVVERWVVRDRGGEVVEQQVQPDREAPAITSISASRSAFGQPRHAVDDELATFWTAGARADNEAPQWIELELAQPRTLQRIDVWPTMPVGAKVTFELRVHDKPIGVARVGDVVWDQRTIEAVDGGRFTISNDDEPLVRGRYVQLRFLESDAWVGLRELRPTFTRSVQPVVLTDDDVTTCWLLDGGASLTLTLQQQATVNRVLMHGGSLGPQWSAVRVSVSSDGESYEPIETGEFEEGEDGVRSLWFAETVETKYIRIAGEASNTRLMINELRVAGPTSTPDATAINVETQAPDFVDGSLVIEEDRTLLPVSDATRTWQVDAPHSHGRGRYVLHGGKGGSVSYEATLKPGWWSVFVWTDRSDGSDGRGGAEASITVEHKDGSEQLKHRLDSETGGWSRLGAYQFDDKKPARVVIAAAKQGEVFADAVRFVAAAKDLGLPPTVENLRRLPVVAEGWEQTDGSKLSGFMDKTLAKQPTADRTRNIDGLRVPGGLGNGVRLRGWVVPPESGDYEFEGEKKEYWQLHLSPNHDKSLLRKVAWEDEGSDRRKSSKFKMISGRSYYFELFYQHNDAGKKSDDETLLKVRWRGKRGDNPVPGWSIIPFGAPVDFHAVDFVPLQIIDATSEKGARLTATGEGAILMNPDALNSDVQTLVADPGFSTINALRIETLPHGSLPGGGPGINAQGLNKGMFLVEEFRFFKADATGKRSPLKVVKATDDGRSFTSAEHAADGHLRSEWRVSDALGQRHTATFVLAEPVELARSDRLIIETHTQLPIGHFRWLATAATDDDTLVTSWQFGDKAYLNLGGPDVKVAQTEWIGVGPYEPNRPGYEVGDKGRGLAYRGAEPVFRTLTEDIKKIRVPAPKGRYKITLLFLDPKHGSKDKREFDIYHEGKRLVEKLDIGDEVKKGEPYHRTFTIDHEDREIHIAFNRRKHLPVCSGVIVERISKD